MSWAREIRETNMRLRTGRGTSHSHPLWFLENNFVVMRIQGSAPSFHLRSNSITSSTA